MAKSFAKATVPYWHKKIGKEKFERYINILKETSPMTEEEWIKPNIAKAIQKYGQFIHLETDITDSSEGLKKKHLDLIDKFNDDEIIEIFNILNSYTNIHSLSQYVDEDGFLSWQRFFNNLAQNEIISNKKYSFNDFKKVIFLHLENNIFYNYQFAKDFVFSMQSIDSLKLLEKEGFLKRFMNQASEIKNSDLSIEDMLKERKTIWKRIQGITPQSKWILLSNPENFSKIFIQKIQSVFKEKQLTKLNDGTQKYIGALLNNFGENIVLLTDKEIIAGEKMMLSFNSENKVDSNISLLKKIGKVEELTLKSLLHYTKFLTENKDLKSELNKKDGITKNDLSVLSYIGEKLNSLPNVRRRRLLKIPFQYWAIFYRYRVPVVTDIEALNDLYEKNKDNKLNIPIISGKIGEYTYEILEKSNPMGLILGYATDCCQVMTQGNQGTQCLVHGYTNPDSTFFVVRKGKKIYAQSWIWQNKDVLCFDSIEVLGRDLNKNKSVLKAYQETANALIEKGYKTVFAGADGNTIPEGLREVGSYYSPCPKELRLPFSCYSDAQAEIIILAGKDDYEGKRDSFIDDDELDD